MAEQHPILNKMPTTLSVGRLLFGGAQAVQIYRKPPSERTWSEAGRTLVAALTDKGDGALTGLVGSTEHGPEWDRGADVTFSGGGELALAVSGEVSAIHPILTFVRESSVQLARHAAVAEDHAPIAVGNRGRQKTTAKMAMVTIARSPLSQRDGLIESMASVGTALSLVSGAQYIGQYFAGKKAVRPKTDKTTARNGAFRQATASPNQKIATYIHNNFPNVTPTHLTRLGELMVETSDVAVLIKPKLGLPIAATTYTAGGLVDGLDGNLARAKKMDSREGMLADVRADKRQEMFTAIINSLLASRNGNSVAAAQYAVAAMTATLPALARAAAEANSHIVSEDASGSRVIRGIEGGFGLGFNAAPGVSNVVSALLMVGNVTTASERADVAIRGEASPHYRGANNDPEFRELGAARRDALIPYALGGMAAGAALLAREYVKVSRSARSKSK